MTTKILVGNNMIKLRELEDESIDCIVTSPPYFGLRDYKSDPYIWGGDENCEHEWSKEPPRRRRHPNDHTKGTLNQIASAPHLKETDSCHKCGAWMGGYGLESTPDQYIKNTLLIFDELHRVLKPQGTVWWNIGDSYAMKSSAWGGSRGHNSILKDTGLADKQRRTGVCPDKLKSKDLMMIPARVAIAVAEHGWYLRSEIIWHKPNPMPESVKDRPTSAHEKIYLFAKNRKYYYDADAVKEKARTKPVVRNKSAEGYQADYPKGERFSEGERTYGDGYANKRNVWTVTTKPFRGAHFAVFPPDLIEPCIKAGTSEYGCCSKCGNPYVRNNQVTSVPKRTTRDNMVGVIPGRDKKSRMNSKEMESLVREDKGWIATCKCNADVKKAVVLDPFGGSGTTGLVANNLGRDAVLIELNEDYVDIAKKRLDEYLGLFSEVKDG